MEKVTRDWQNQYMVPLFCPPDFIPVKGQGCHVWDQEGREYIDISGGIAVNSLGHCNPELVKALTEQANNIWHVSNLLTSEPLLRLAKRITEATFADTLILIDEFGAGTEPQIGGAIAQALLRQFNAKGMWGVITTHFRNLKQFADDTAGLRLCLPE